MSSNALSRSSARQLWRDREQCTPIADVLAILTALTLPWSISLVSIFVLCWFGAVAWVMNWGAYARLFEKAATGDTYTSQVIGNPHDQTLNVAVQWGIIGVILLYAIWLMHLPLFRGEGLVAWIGLLVVAQNIFTSLFNSHICDFHEGWMYVLGIGVAGGMVLKDRSPGDGGEPSGIARS